MSFYVNLTDDISTQHGNVDVNWVSELRLSSMSINEDSHSWNNVLRCVLASHRATNALDQRVVFVCALLWMNELGAKFVCAVCEELEADCDCSDHDCSREEYACWEQRTHKGEYIPRPDTERFELASNAHAAIRAFIEVDSSDRTLHAALKSMERIVIGTLKEISQREHIRFHNGLRRAAREQSALKFGDSELTRILRLRGVCAVDCAAWLYPTSLEHVSADLFADAHSDSYSNTQSQ